MRAVPATSVHALCIAAICLCVLPPSAVAGVRSPRNAGVTWGSGSGGDIRGANVDGSGRLVLGGSAYRIRTDGRGRRPILCGLRNPVVRWSPDGRRLLYTSGTDAWTADLDGTHRKRVLHHEVIEGIAWRPGFV